MIREATISDAKALSELSLETYIEAFGYPYEDKLEMERWIEETRSERYFIEAIKRGPILVAEEGGRLVGYAEFGKVGPGYPISKKETRDQQISRIYVVASYQGRGIGHALLDRILEYSNFREAKNIYLDVQIDNKRAQRLYESYGFKDTGESMDGDMIMVKRRN